MLSQFLDATPLYLGAIYDHLEIVKYLYSIKANIEARNKNGGFARCSIISKTCMVLVLLCDVVCHWLGRTPLHDAAQENNIEIVKYLVHIKAYIEAKDVKGRFACSSISISSNIMENVAVSRYVQLDAV